MRRLLLILATLTAAVPNAVSGPGSQPSSETDLLVPLPTDADSLARLTPLLPGGAKRLETEHFILVHNAKRQAVERLAARLEVVYRAHARFVRTLCVIPRRPEHKLEVLVFGTYAEFVEYQQQQGWSHGEILGLYDSSAGRSVFCDLQTYPPVVRMRAELSDLRQSDWPRRKALREKLRQRTEALNAKVIQHEAAHQIQFTTGLLPAGDGCPAWLAEGLAQLFELPFIERGATLERATNRYRLHEFTELHGGPDTLADLRRLVSSEAAVLDGRDYSLAWALTDYLYVRQREPLAQYLTGLAVPRPAAGASPAARLRQFEGCFGQVDERFAGQFGTHLQSLQARYPNGP